MNWIYVTLGSISLGLGILGIFLPLLPTTPFLLLTAALYLRGSERLYDWLLSNKYLGSYIRNYQENKAIPLRAKIFSIALLWITILFSVFFVVNHILLIVLLLIIAICVSVHLLSFKTLGSK